MTDTKQLAVLLREAEWLHSSLGKEAESRLSRQTSLHHAHQASRYKAAAAELEAREPVACASCGKPVYGYQPEYCCDGSDCGCMGLPVEPPFCDECPKDTTPPAPQVPVQSFEDAMNQMMAAATREGHKVKVDVKYALLAATQPEGGDV